MPDPGDAAAPAGTGASGQGNHVVGDDSGSLPTTAANATEASGQQTGPIEVGRGLLSATATIISGPPLADLYEAESGDPIIDQVAIEHLPAGAVLDRARDGHDIGRVIWNRCQVRLPMADDLTALDQIEDVESYSIVPVALAYRSEADRDADRARICEHRYQGVLAAVAVDAGGIMVATESPVHDGDALRQAIAEGADALNRLAAAAHDAPQAEACVLLVLVALDGDADSQDVAELHLRQRCELLGMPAQSPLLHAWHVAADPGAYIYRGATALSAAEIYRGGPTWSAIHEHGEEEATIEWLRQRMLRAAHVAELDDAATRAKIEDMPAGCRQELADLYGKRRGDFGQFVSANDARRAVELDMVAYHTRDGCPVWARGWMHDRSADHMVHRLTGERCSVRAFDLAMAPRMLTPRQRADGVAKAKLAASNLLLGRGLIPSVAGVRYRPGLGETFDKDGANYANSWVDDAVPPKPESQWTDDDRQAVDLWSGHLSRLLHVDAVLLLLRIFAFIARHPGRRVRWAFLIQGPEGVGKTLALFMLGMIAVGRRNIGKVSNSEVSHATFNEWAEGRTISILDELFVDGRNKYAVVNALKAVITDDEIGIHPKGRRGHTAVNVTTYLVTTNETEPLPLNEGSRRWYITETIPRSKDEFIEALGGPVAADAYFTALAQAAENHGPALRAWILDRQSDSVPGQAPITDAARGLIESSRSEIEQQILDIIRGDGPDALHPLVTPDVIHLHYLRHTLSRMSDAPPPTSQKLGRLLRKLGYETASPGPIHVPLPVHAHIPHDLPQAKAEKSRWYIHQRLLKASGGRKRVALIQEATRRWAEEQGHPFVSDLSQWMVRTQP